MGGHGGGGDERGDQFGHQVAGLFGDAGFAEGGVDADGRDGLACTLQGAEGVPDGLVSRGVEVGADDDLAGRSAGQLGVEAGGENGLLGGGVVDLLGNLVGFGHQAASPRLLGLRRIHDVSSCGFGVSATALSGRTSSFQHSPLSHASACLVNCGCLPAAFCAAM